MYTKILHSTDDLGSRALALKSHHNRSSKRPPRADLAAPRTESDFNSKSYRDALQRAFNRAKQQVFFNPDMQYFVTLTYAENQTDYEIALYDVKQMAKNERRNGNKNFKYIYVFEYQKRGAIHIHMITNAALTTYINKNGYKSLTYWKHGFTSMLHIDDFDGNFKPHLYLFKYMRKSQRIGKSFVHSSRNLNNFKEMPDDHFDHSYWRVVTQERNFTTLSNGKKLSFYRYYMLRDTMFLPATNKREKTTWQPKGDTSNYLREPAKNPANHSQRSS